MHSGHIKINLERVGVVANTWNLSTQELRQEDFKFKISLGYVVSSGSV
jgi:hypothetical protein